MVTVRADYAILHSQILVVRVSHPHALRAQLLNTSSASIFAGDLVEWTLSYSDAMKSHAKRARHGPRRIGIQTATVSSPKVIGRALSFAKPGEPIDLLLKQ